jgi:regulator of replication initiation timing
LDITGDKATTLQKEKSKLTETKEEETMKNKKHAPVHKEFILAALYGDCLKICKEFAPNFGDKRTGCFMMTMHSLALPFPNGEFFTETT